MNDPLLHVVGLFATLLDFLDNTSFGTLLFLAVVSWFIKNSFGKREDRHLVLWLTVGVFIAYFYHFYTHIAGYELDAAIRAFLVAAVSFGAFHMLVPGVRVIARPIGRIRDAVQSYKRRREAARAKQQQERVSRVRREAAEQTAQRELMVRQQAEDGCVHKKTFRPLAKAIITPDPDRKAPGVQAEAKRDHWVHA